MRLGYNTNGFAHHRLEDAIAILAELGYESVALTLDYHALNPYDEGECSRQAKALRALLERRAMDSVVETGARFLLDPRRKHQPTLLSPTQRERDRRVDFLCRAVDLARDLESDAVSFWSGRTSAPAPDGELMKRLVAGCRRLCDYAIVRGVR